MRLTLQSILLLLYFAFILTAKESKQEFKSITFGFTAGEMMLLAPNTMTNSPTAYLENVDESLSNGLNGIGFGTTFCGSAKLLYNIPPKPSSQEKKREIDNPLLDYPDKRFYYSGRGFLQLYLSADYASWASSNSIMNSNNVIFQSKNELSMIGTAIGLKYYYINNFFVAPEISINFFNTSVSEDSERGNLDFKKMYTRLGAGLSFGTNINFTDSFYMDLSLKAMMPNLLLKEDDAGESEALIKSFNGIEEQSINTLSLNLGIYYSLF